MKLMHASIGNGLIGLALLAAVPVMAQNFKPLVVPSPLGDEVRQLAVDERGPDGSTPLQWAVYDGDHARVEALIRAGADVNAANNYNATAMMLAAEVGDPAMLELLLKAGADVESANPEGQTALMLVARTGNVEAAKLLVRAGADVNARESWGEQSALMWASARRHPAMMEFLLEAGADIDAQSTARDYRRHLTKEGRAKSLDSGGLTPLLYAVRENCKSCVEVLVNHGVDLDLPDPDGVSPLLLSVINSNWDIASQLIDAGADVDQWSVFGQAPLFTAAAQRRDSGLRPNDVPNIKNGLDVVQTLLKAGANPNMQLFLRPAKFRGSPASRGTTPLIMAAANGDVEVIRLLLEYGAKADLPQADLQTPVSALAGANGNQQELVEGLKLLISAGADPNVVAVHHHLQRVRGGSPFHYAVLAGNDEVIRALVDLGGDINVRDHDGVTALDYAMARGFVPFNRTRPAPQPALADMMRSLGATDELDVLPFWPNVGPPFYYPWSIFPLDPEAEKLKLVPGSFDHM
jgi:ankyrin repeat protein